MKTFKSLTESLKSSSNPKEYDFEGEMTKKDLEIIKMHADHLISMLDDKDNLPEWVQSKITIAKDYMQTVCDYLYAENK